MKAKILIHNSIYIQVYQAAFGDYGSSLYNIILSTLSRQFYKTTSLTFHAFELQNQKA